MVKKRFKRGKIEVKLRLKGGRGICSPGQNSPTTVWKSPLRYPRKKGPCPCITWENSHVVEGRKSQPFCSTLVLLRFHLKLAHFDEVLLCAKKGNAPCWIADGVRF